MFPGSEKAQSRCGRGIPPAANHPPVVEEGVAVAKGRNVAILHVINIADGQDVVLSILHANQSAPPQDATIMCCFGSVSNPTICSPGPNPIRRTLEGRFQIFSLAGIFTKEENGGGLVLSIAMDGHIIGGTVAAPMIAAGPVKVMLLCFG